MMSEKSNSPISCQGGIDPLPRDADELYDRAATVLQDKVCEPFIIKPKVSNYHRNSYQGETDEDEDDPDIESTDIDNQPIFKNCIHLGGYGDSYICAYAPHQPLDTDLFFALTTDAKLVKHPNMKIATAMNRIDFDCEQYSVGKLYYDYNYPRCAACKWCVPADQEFYTSNDSGVPHHLCRTCASDRDTTAFKRTKYESGFGNISDWVSIFAYMYSYKTDWGSRVTITPYYCNLNPTSSYYKHFASNGYVSQLGTKLELINLTNLSDVIETYCPGRTPVRLPE